MIEKIILGVAAGCAACILSWMMGKIINTDFNIGFYIGLFAGNFILHAFVWEHIHILELLGKIIR